MTYTLTKPVPYEDIQILASKGYVIFWHTCPETKKETAIRIPQPYFAELVKKAQLLIDEDRAKRDE